MKDVQTGDRTRFIADQWLAVDRGDYEDDIHVHAIPADDRTAEDAYYLMKAAGSRKISDDHLWWSVFSRPIRSGEYNSNLKKMFGKKNWFLSDPALTASSA